MTFARQTHGLIKFAKIAYPDLVGGQSPVGIVEPLLEKNKQACRYFQKSAKKSSKGIHFFISFPGAKLSIISEAS